MTTLSHPYMKSSDLFPIPKERVEGVDALFEWIKEQPRFPNFTKNHAHLFLHACIWNLEDAKKALQKYSHIRGASPDIFDNRDPLSQSVQLVWNMTHMVSLPKLTPEGYKILCYRLSDTDPSKIHFGDAVKSFCMFNDVQISKDGPLDGYIVLFDMKGVRLGHLARVQFGPLRTFMSYIQDAHPVRLKKIYIVHTASFINQVMALVKPLIRSELLGLLNFTTAGPSEILGIDLLPEDYGGPHRDLATMHSEQRKEIETEYREWLIDSNELREIPKEKHGSSSSSKLNSTQSTIKPPVQGFKGLEID